MDIKEKENFLKRITLEKLELLKENTIPLWGKMNARQMVEHISEYLEHANGKQKLMVLTEQEKLPAFKAFLMSEKEFKPGTPNSQMPEIPAPERLSSLDEAKEEFQINLYKFFERFSGRELETENHLFFGTLNYEEWIRIAYKHILHHFKQFGLVD